MDFRREEIMPGVFLSALRAERFKTSAMCAVLLTQLERGHAYMDSLIPSVLRRGTVRYPDMASVTRRLDELYGAAAVPVSLRVGEVRALGFYASFPEGKYLPGGRGELAEAASLLGELLSAPNTRGGLLLPDYVNSEKHKLAEKIRAAKNNRESYAMGRLIELMCSCEDLGAAILSDPEEAEAVYYTKLTRRYRQLLAESPLEIVYCGAEDFADVRGAALAAFGGIPRGELNFEIGTDVRMNAVEAEPRRFFETMDVRQGKLCMGWRLGECMEEPDFAALRVFNAVYGGTASSRLFRQLREERSLCYYASSGIDDVKGLMYVASGIDKANYAEAEAGIRSALESLGRDGPAEDELAAAKEYCASALRLMSDDPVELLLHTLKMNAVGEEIAPDELAAACEYVTAEEVAAIARGCELDAVYFLSGEDGEEAEA